VHGQCPERQHTTDAHALSKRVGRVKEAPDTQHTPWWGAREPTRGQGGGAATARPPPSHTPQRGQHGRGLDGSVIRADSCSRPCGQRGSGEPRHCVESPPRARPPSWTACSGLQAARAVPSSSQPVVTRKGGAPERMTTVQRARPTSRKADPDRGRWSGRWPRARASRGTHTPLTRQAGASPSARAHRAAPRLSRCDSGAARRGVPDAHPWRPPLCESRR